MVKAIIVGLGPLGQKVAHFALQRKCIKLVGAVDIAPELVGKDLGSVIGVKKMGLRIAGDVKTALGRKKADVAVLTTVSSIKALEPQIAGIAAQKLNIVSTCEELSFPWRRAKASARRIDAVCRKAGVACLGTGVNPGFLMDFLPAILTAVNQDVRKIVVERVQDASTRRIPFQKKIGAGLTRTEFKKRADDGSLRHVGLLESVDMIAHAMGWTLTDTKETLRPVIAEKRITSGHLPIAPGMACGVEQIGRGYIGRKQVITLHFRAAVGEPKSYDQARIEGRPKIVSTIEGGVNGDIATCAIVLNAAHAILGASPGLKTMLDVPAVTFRR